MSEPSGRAARFNRLQDGCWEMNTRKLFAVVAGLFLLLLSPAALALKCVDANSGGLSILQQIPSNIAIAADAPAGTVIWESPQFTVTMKCTRDWGVPTDGVYLYVNPGSVAPATGTEIGIRLNGTVYRQSSGRIYAGYTLQATASDLTFPMTFTVVLLKTGTSPASGTAVFTSYRVFQVDGDQGLNAHRNSNLNFLLTGQVLFVGCYATLTFQPSSTIDFGTLLAVGVAGSVAATRPLTLTATRPCTSSYKLGVSFNATSPTTLAGSGTWNLGNGMGVSLIDGITGSTVPLDGTVTEFVDLGRVATAGRSYTVQLSRLVANARVGAFSGTMTVLLDYK
ncbi:hypothetical protein [Paraburkholderia silvatlantica]|uniref:hypothetical protein n=1 Tax=Paraburkholderia silvatlantica TaxID=321895 RepID=UPI0037514450